jgi:hypothetical protein
VNENREIGEFMQNQQDRPAWCFVANTTCHSKAEWQTLIKPYMERWPMRWLVPALLAGILLASRPTHADEPSLTETLLWMDNTYNPHEHYLGHGKWETFKRR